MYVAAAAEWMDRAKPNFTNSREEGRKGRKAVTAHEICPLLKAAAPDATGAGAGGGISLLLLRWSLFSSAAIFHQRQLWHCQFLPLFIPFSSDWPFLPVICIDTSEENVFEVSRSCSSTLPIEALYHRAVRSRGTTVNIAAPPSFERRSVSVINSIFISLL